MILDEFALIPDIFDARTYSSPDLAPVFLTQIRRPLMEEAQVANLRAGEWMKWVQHNLGDYHLRAKSLITDLLKSGRIVSRPSQAAEPCHDGREWCAEALATHAVEPLTGIVASQNLLGEIGHLGGPIETVERLHLAAWWKPGVCTMNRARTLDEYRSVLSPVLRHANSAMFIDPHLDPGEVRYSGFGNIVGLLAGRNPAPMIEIHRVVSHGSGQQRRPQPVQFWQTQFEILSGQLRALGLKASVFLWDNFHDRFVITNHIGIALSNGFDTTTDPDASMIWSRMERRVADDKQREFHPDAGRHRCVARFEIGS